MTEWQQILLAAVGNNVISVFLLAAIVYLIKEIARLNLVITETRKEKDALQQNFLERVLSAVERLDLPGPK